MHESGIDIDLVTLGSRLSTVFISPFFKPSFSRTVSAVQLVGIVFQTQIQPGQVQCLTKPLEIPSII